MLRAAPPVARTTRRRTQPLRESGKAPSKPRVIQSLSPAFLPFVQVLSLRTFSAYPPVGEVVSWLERQSFVVVDSEPPPSRLSIVEPVAFSLEVPLNRDTNQLQLLPVDVGYLPPPSRKHLFVKIFPSTAKTKRKHTARACVLVPFVCRLVTQFRPAHFFWVFGLSVFFCYFEGGFQKLG